ncbi:hypothetical protein LTR37_006277 [Vermiconidia calcicola]|uniref:Uncharacterized protein n=1 Tax=Vermiconidia calcicola TaxID=1690605 RepID=A0ACC3NGQ0_9PEZI|nr:hypothetical protein LTR37_006277 [Vermiconidia calcicola]
MPPKGAQKPKAQAPEPEPAKPKANAPPKTPSPKKKPKPKQEPSLQVLDRDTRAPIAIEVMIEGQSVQAQPTKNGPHGHVLKLEAPGAFALVKTVMFTEGEFEGLQAILLRPAKAFPFLKLPEEVRNRIYKIYFAPGRVIDNPIVIEGRRNSNKEMWAKAYSESSKTRVGLLAVNKEIYKEAVPILYAHNLLFDSTSTLLDFLSQTPAEVKPRLRNITAKHLVKTQSRNCFLNLAPATNITRLHIVAGVASEADPAKAAKTFYGDAYRFLEAVGAKKGDKMGGVDVLSFGKQALVTKDEKKNPKPYDEEMREEFMDTLKSKLK